MLNCCFFIPAVQCPSTLTRLIAQKAFLFTTEHDENENGSEVSMSMSRKEEERCRCKQIFSLTSDHRARKQASLKVEWIVPFHQLNQPWICSHTCQRRRCSDLRWNFCAPSGPLYAGWCETQGSKWAGLQTEFSEVDANALHQWIAKGSLVQRTVGNAHCLPSEPWAMHNAHCPPWAMTILYSNCTCGQVLPFDDLLVGLLNLTCVPLKCQRQPS